MVLAALTGARCLCRAEVIDDLRESNPDLLAIAAKCAASLGNGLQVMLGLSLL
jgi:hypothetical protein